MEFQRAPRPVPATGWPELPLEAWQDTRDTLHMWTQIVGKVRLSLTPLINHWWNVPLFVSSRGLTTSMIPYGERWFEMTFDFRGDALRISTSDGIERTVPLVPQTVAEFYDRTMSELHAAGIDPAIWPVPVEIEHPIPFAQDREHRAYDKEYVMRFWHIVGRVDEILEKFRGRFIGKASPVMFYWGTFDLSTSRYSGRRAPVLDRESSIEREAYSHEVQSVGWWPGDRHLPRAAFFSYVVPEPPGLAQVKIATPHVYYHPTLKGFYLHYDDVRAHPHPAALLLEFAESTYAAAADLAGWDRANLERPRAA